MAINSEARILVTAQDQASASLKKIESSMESVGRTASQLRNLFAGAFSAQAVISVLKSADAYNTLQARIASTTKATGDYVQVSTQLAAIAARTGTSLQDTVAVFQRLALAAPELGATNSQMLQLTDAVQKLGSLGGASTSALSAGLLQFGQAMSAGVMRAEELNSIIVNLPLLADAIADGMGMTVGELRKAVLEGRVLSKDVFGALLKQTDDINRRFQDMPTSMERGWNAFMQGLDQAIARLNNALGLTERIGGNLQSWGERLRDATPQERFSELVAERERLKTQQPAGPGGRPNPAYNSAQARLREIDVELRGLSVAKQVEQQKEANAMADAEFEAAVRASEAAVKAENAAYQDWLKTQAKATKTRGGGSGASAALSAQRELERYQRAYVALLDNIQVETAQIGLDLVDDTRQRLDMEMTLERQYWEERIALYAEGTEERKRLEDELASWTAARQALVLKESRTPLQRLAADWADTARQMEDAIAGWAESTADAIARFVVTGKADFRSLIDSILMDLARMQAQKVVAGLAGLLADKIGTGLFSGLFSAHGNAFDRGRVVPFASGGVISSPTVFPLGVAGEAGPEAILPLSRLSGGDLGVKAGVNNVVVNVIEGPGHGGEVRQRDDQGMKMIDVIVEKVKGSIAGDMAQGRGALPQVMERTYGLNRVAGAY
jgi:lambda family phage tail tape measure protein